MQVFLLCKKLLKHLLGGEKIRDKTMSFSRLPVHVSSNIANGGKCLLYNHPYVMQVSCCWARFPLGWSFVHWDLLDQKKVCSSTTVVVEGFTEGLICLWEIKQDRICHSGCHWIWDRWGLLASNPRIWERGEACLEAGRASCGLGNREKQNRFHKLRKMSFTMSRAG